MSTLWTVDKRQLTIDERKGSTSNCSDDVMMIVEMNDVWIVWRAIVVVPL